MKVMLFLPSFGAGGAERVTATLATHWALTGWEVSVVTLAPLGREQFELPRSVGRIGLGLLGQVAGPFGGLRANLRRVMGLRRLLQQERPDAIVAMMGTPSVLLAVAGAGLRGIRRVGTERIHPPRLPLGRVWEWLRARTYRWLDVVVAQTGASADWILAHTSARRVVVIPNPVPWPLPSSSPERAPQSVGTPGRRRALAVGRLDPQKGFDLLIDAFGRVAQEHPEWELVIVGEGEERPRLQAAIDGAGLGGRVVLAGLAGNLGAWYEAADLFVLSSRFEGFPNALVEAMACGCAVASFDCETGPGEIVHDGSDGLLVPDGDVGGLATALGRLMGDAALRERLATRAREVRERFALPAIHLEWAAVLAGAEGRGR